MERLFINHIIILNVSCTCCDKHSLGEYNKKCDLYTFKKYDGSLDYMTAKSI